MQKHANRKISKLINEIRNLSANFKRFEPDLEVGKKVNDALVKQVASLERHLDSSILCDYDNLVIKVINVLEMTILTTLGNLRRLGVCSIPI